MALVANAGVWLTRQTPPGGWTDPFTTAHGAGGAAASPLGADGLVQAMATGAMRLAAASNVQVYAARSNVVLGAQGTSNVLVVGSNAVTIHGDLRVRGGIDALVSAELFVSDRVIRVSVPTPSNDVVAEADLDGAGLAVARGLYAKDVRWRAGAGTAAPVADTMLSAAAPYWEARGGALRFTLPTRADAAKAAAGGSVGYAFRINASEQLEIVKVWRDSAADAERSMRVFCAGPPRTPTDVGAAPLPTSVCPYA